METSLFDLGKSSEDLWAFAALFAADHCGVVSNKTFFVSFLLSIFILIHRIQS